MTAPLARPSSSNARDPLSAGPSSTGRTSAAGGSDVFVCALAAGFWPYARLQQDRAGFLLPASVEPLSLPASAWLVLLFEASLIALALLALARGLRAGAERPAAEEPSPGLQAAALLAILGAALVLRSIWSDLVPPGLWADTVWGLRAAAEAGRFLRPDEAVLLYPPEMGPSRLLVSGFLVDVVRAALLSSGDRLVAYRLVSLVPSALCVPAVFLLGRRLGGPRLGLGAAVLCAFASWNLVLGRWGWSQQMTTVLAVLALERLVAGLAERSRPALASGAVLAGLACHAYLAGWLAAIALLLWAATELWRDRRPKDAVVVARAFLATGLPLAGPYVRDPSLLGGRVGDVALRGTLPQKARDAASNVVDYVGELFLVPDPNPRHGLPGEALMGPVLLALFVLGLTEAARRRLWLDPRWRGVLAVATLLVGGASLTMRESAPNAYRTGTLAPLACCVAGLGLSALAGDPSRSPFRRRVLAGALVAGVAFTETDRFLRWGLPERGNRAFLGDATAIAGFVEQVGPSRVEIEPLALAEGIGPARAAAFLAGRREVTTAPPLLPMLPASGGTAVRTPGRWLVALRRPPEPGRSVQIGFPPASSPRLVALPPTRPEESRVEPSSPPEGASGPARGEETGHPPRTILRP